MEFKEPSQITPREIENTLRLASVNNPELKRALQSLKKGDFLDLLTELREIPGSVIKHPYGYYEIPLFEASLEEKLKSKIPFRVLPDDHKIFRDQPDSLAVFDGEKAVIRQSYIDPIKRVTAIVCRSIEESATEQTLEHEIRHGLIRKYLTRLGEYRLLSEGFAYATYGGYVNLSVTKTVGGRHYNETERRIISKWLDLTRKAQAAGKDDLEIMLLVQKLSFKKDWVRWYGYWERIAKARVEAEKTLESISLEKFDQDKNRGWSLLRYHAFKKILDFMNGKGIKLSLQTPDEFWRKYVRKHYGEES